MKKIIWFVEVKDAISDKWQLLDYTASVSRATARIQQRRFRVAWGFTRIVRYERMDDL